VDIVFDYHRLGGGNNTFSKLILLVLTVGRIREQKEGDANRVRFQRRGQQPLSGDRAIASGAEALPRTSVVRPALQRKKFSFHIYL
jgi:hypothetical protein